MYQVIIALPKSSGYDASILQVPIATVTGAGSVALLIGESTTLTYGQLQVRLRECIEALMEKARQGVGGVVSARMSPATNGKPSIVVGTTNALAAETSVAAIANDTGDLDGRTELIFGGLVQCLEVFRETVLTSGLTIKP